MWDESDRRRQLAHFTPEFLGSHHERALRLGHVHDFVVRAHDGAIGTMLSRESLNDLVGLFTPFGIDHLHTRSMLPPFDRLSLLPPIEDNGDRMALAMTIGREVLEQRLSGRFRPKGRPNGEKVVAVDDQVNRHAQTLRPTAWACQSHLSR